MILDTLVLYYILGYSEIDWHLLWKSPDVNAYPKASSYQTDAHWFEVLMDGADQIDPEWEFLGKNRYP